MNRLIAGLILLACTVPVLADEADLKEARARWLHGNYDEARGAYEKLLKDEKAAVPAAIGLSVTLQSLGEYDKALEVIDTALASRAKSADLLGRRAELLYLRGRWKDAEEAAGKALELKKDQFLARYIRALLARDRGDTKAADIDFRWFVRTYSERSNNDDDIKVPEELLLVGLAGAENARWHNLSDQFAVVLRDVYGDALKNDKQFWPAEYQAGMLLLEKYNTPDAVDAFDKALTINPSAAEAMVGKGRAALQKYEIADAERLAEKALKVNVRLPEALRLRADIHMMGGNYAGALKELETARQVNPRDETTLGRIAACYFLDHKQEAFDKLVKEILEFDPKPGIFYAALAERLDDRRHYDEAEANFKTAIELRPLLPDPRNDLGLLLMRMGKEKEARTVLTEAFQADPFNIRVANTLKVLRHVDKYETLTTEHFVLRYDAKTDTAMAHLLAELLEEQYAKLSETFQFKPKGAILVELFNNHDMFSGRVVALPDLHTIGACTGRMFALDSPHARGIAKPFNWARVVRHELVHIFNLEQTHFQVPHWLTEGLAVNNEGFPRPQIWNQLLQEKVAANELMTLDNVDLGFIRPRSPVEWQMAYCQSQIYVDYLRSKYGPKSVGEMLAAYGDGLGTEAAITRVCKVDKATFEKGYLDYLHELVKSIRGRPAEKPMTIRELEQAHTANPADEDLTARLADNYRERNRTSEARKMAEEVLAKNKKHPLANYVKARLLQQAGDDDEARRLLEFAASGDSPEPKALLALGKLYYESKDLDKAAAVFERARKAQPTDSRWLTELARVHAQANDKEKLIAVLKDLVPTDADDLDTRKRLARLLLESNRYAEAEKYARESLEIDVVDAESRSVLMAALKGQKKDAEVTRMEKLLGPAPAGRE
jgi:tetratricopeptide (TPR) repeat protein